MASQETAEDFLAAAEGALAQVKVRKPLFGSREFARNELNQRIAPLYLAHPQVERVELFGSFARGEGNSYSDYDLIVVVDEYLADAWLEALEDRDVDFNNGQDIYYSKRLRRWDASASLLNILAVSLWHAPDILLFPPNWRDEEELTRLQEAGNHHDPDFMRNIAHDAITFDPTTGSFPWP